MSKPLRDGESRTIRKRYCTLDFEVVAQCVDSDTPYILLQFKGGEIEQLLTDGEAQELIYRLQKALDIFPSSK